MVNNLILKSVHFDLCLDLCSVGMTSSICYESTDIPTTVTSLSDLVPNLCGPNLVLSFRSKFNFSH